LRKLCVTLKHFNLNRRKALEKTNPFGLENWRRRARWGYPSPGHYLWPLYALWVHTTSGVELRPKGIIGWGAGRALSLVALQLYQEYAQQLVVTDHDPGTVERARDNHEETWKNCTANERNRRRRTISSH
jgi:hypothetical protein